MVKLKYIGNHQPQGMIIEVDEIKAKKIIDNENYEYLVSKNNDVSTKKCYPSIKWKEKDILIWIKENKIPIIYNISNDRKDNVLKKLKDGGYLNDNDIRRN